jgi:hypothetical protein
VYCVSHHNHSQVGKLNVYRNADADELSTLHPSDRLMVQLIKIDRLGPRIEGMLYKCAFEETWALLDDVRINHERVDLATDSENQGAKKLAEAGQALLQAKNFKELLSVCELPEIWLSVQLNPSLAHSFDWELHERHWRERRCIWLPS